MKRKGNLFKSFIAIFAVAFTMILTACAGGSKENMAKITWEVPTEAHVKVDKMDKLPQEFEKGKTLVFEISCDEGFKVANVKANGRRVAARGKRYNVIVKQDVTVKVDVKKEVSSLEITAKPTKLVYFAGESVDPAGMVVKAKYADGTTEEIKKGIDGYKISPTSFVGGEDKFTVEYDGKKADVMLDRVAEFKVSINPNGGKIKDSWINPIKDLNLNNFNVAEDGTVSFSYYNNLPKNIQLPKAEDMEYLDHTFLGWSDGFELTNQTNASKETFANWQAELVTVSKIYMTTENNTPYLIVEGNYRLADKVQLFLYEGNVNAGVKGDIYTNTGDKYSKFTAKFDLTKLVETEGENGESLEGKWMDVRFVAEIDGKEESMEVFIGDGSGVENDLNQKLQTQTHTFSFAQWNNYIKVYYNETNYQYTLDFQEKDGNEFIIIEGKTSKAFVNMNIAISWYFNGGKADEPICISKIGADGSFRIEMNINDVPQYQTGWAHVTIYKEEIESPEFGNFQTNLFISQCLTKLEQVTIPDCNIHRAVKFTAKNGVSYYLGCENEGLMCYAYNENKELKYDSFGMELVNGKAMYVVSGSYKAYTKEELNFEFDIQSNGNLGGNWSPVVERVAFDSIEIDEEAKTFKLMFNVSDKLAANFTEANSDRLGYIVHMGTGAKFGDVKEGTDSKALVIIDGIEYSIQRSNETFGMAGIVLRKTDKANGAYELSFNDAKLENKNGRAVVTVTANCSGFTQEDFNKVGLQVLGGDWSMNVMENATVSLANNVLTVTIDITDLAANSYMVKLDTYAGDMQDLKLTKDINDEGIKIGDKHYRLTCKSGATAQEDFFGLLGVVISNANN